MVCTAFSLSTAMDNAILRLGKREVMSPLHVWSRYRVPEIDKAGDSIWTRRSLRNRSGPTIRPRLADSHRILTSIVRRPTTYKTTAWTLL